MARFLDTLGGPGPLAAPAYLTPQERRVLARAPKRAPPTPAGVGPADPKRARATEGGAGRIMDLIASGEGTDRSDGYDLVYGYDRYKPAGTPPVTGMTLNRLGDLQREMLARGSKSTAFGRYQMTKGTREDMQKAMGLSGEEVATSGIQDRMMRELLKTERFEDFVSGRLSPEGFQRNLARRFDSWAAGPDDRTYPRNGRTKDPKVKTRAIQDVLRAAKAEHEQYLRTDPYIQRRLEEGYMPDMTRWR